MESEIPRMEEAPEHRYALRRRQLMSELIRELMGRSLILRACIQHHWKLLGVSLLLNITATCLQKCVSYCSLCVGVCVLRQESHIPPVQV